MIKQLLNYIEKYLNGEVVDTPDGYEDIYIDESEVLGNYYFYYFLEDFLGREDLYMNDSVDEILDSMHSIAIEMEPMKDTTDMDKRLKDLYLRLIKLI